jgi:hypothetical protein
VEGSLTDSLLSGKSSQLKWNSELTLDFPEHLGGGSTTVKLEGGMVFIPLIRTV